MTSEAHFTSISSLPTRSLQRIDFVRPVNDHGAMFQVDDEEMHRKRYLQAHVSPVSQALFVVVRDMFLGPGLVTPAAVFSINVCAVG